MSRLSDDINKSRVESIYLRVKTIRACSRLGCKARRHKTCSPDSIQGLFEPWMR